MIVAVRSADTSQESIQEEIKMWNVSGVACESGYLALPIGASKHPPFQFFGMS